MKLENSLINDIRSKVDIVEVISSYIPLATRGKNYFGVCPFHDDHSPSLSVSKDKQIYTCFSCGATGNVFNFLQEYEHISYVEAIKKCADMCGITIELGNTSENKFIEKNKTLYDIYEISCKFYQNNIHSTYGHSAKAYLYSRSLTDDDIKKFDIGLSLDGYDTLVKLLQHKSFTEKDILKSGLANANEEHLYDIYRNRIMFPLHDISGHAIGYNGRAYQGDMTNKYVNSKETAIFKKRDFLYNYHRARDSARAQREIIIMEGPMDVIRASSVGIDNVVATLGTSFSSSQCNLIKRLSTNVILCFDGDDAGLKATKLAIKELQNAGINPKIVRLPDRADPDEYIKKYGKDRFQYILEHAYNIMEFNEILFKQEINFNDPEDVSKYINAMIVEINKIDDDILKDLTINKLCEETKISKELIMSKVINNNEKKKIVISKPKSKKKTKYEKSIQGLLYYMLKDGKVIDAYEQEPVYIPDENYRQLAFQISAFYQKNGYINVADLLTELNEDEESIKTVGDVVALNLKDDYDDEEIEDYLKNIKENNDLKQIDKYKNALVQSNDLNEKLELANKLIAYKLRSEEND